MDTTTTERRHGIEWCLTHKEPVMFCCAKSKADEPKDESKDEKDEPKDEPKD